jgi:hypothetical protein
MDELRKSTALNLVALATKRNEHECTLTVEICTRDEIDMDELDASHVILLRFTSQARKREYGMGVKNGVFDDTLITFCKKVEAGDYCYSDGEIDMAARWKGKSVLHRCFIRYHRSLFVLLPEDGTMREFIVSHREMLKLVDVVLYNPPLLT